MPLCRSLCSVVYGAYSQNVYIGICGQMYVNYSLCHIRKCHLVVVSVFLQILFCSPKLYVIYLTVGMSILVAEMIKFDLFFCGTLQFVCPYLPSALLLNFPLGSQYFRFFKHHNHTLFVVIIISVTTRFTFY